MTEVNTMAHFTRQAEPARCIQAVRTRDSLHDVFQRAHAPEEFGPTSMAVLRRRVKRGRPVFNSGDEFTALYTVRHGFFKTCVVDCDGREQVSGFLMAGDSFGLDGFGSGRHDAAAIALEDSEVWVMPLAVVDRAARHDASFERDLNAELAREIVRGHGVMMLLGCMTAEERLAAFLVNLSERFAARGYSSCDFHLRMTRGEIASYIGVKHETVCRLFASFAREGLIKADQKRLQILDVGALSARSSPGARTSAIKSTTRVALAR